MDVLTITLIVVAAASAFGTITTAIAGIFWSAKIREAKDTLIQTLREAKDSEITALQRQLADSKELNSSKVRQFLIDTEAVLGQQIEGLKVELTATKKKVEELETSGPQAQRDSALEKIASLERELQMAGEVAEAFGVLVPGLEDVWHGNPLPVSIEKAHDYAQKLLDGQIHLHPVDPDEDR